MADGKAKRPSGAEFKRRRAERERAALAAEARAAGLPVGDDGDGELAAFADLGAPPLDDPEKALSWVRRYQLTALYVAATRPITPALEKRLRYLKEFGATIGMTHNRTAMEDVAERIEALLAAVKPAGAVDLQATDGDDPDPETARGGSRTRRPRAVP